MPYSLYLSPPPASDDSGPLVPPSPRAGNASAQKLSAEHPDHALIIGIRAGDPAALKALIDRYTDPLVHFAAQLVGSDEAAEDAVQDVFVRVWERREVWYPQVGVRAYLFGAVRNTVYMIRRHQRVVDREHAALAFDLPQTVAPIEPDDSAHMRRQFRNALKTLTGQQRAVLRLRYDQRLSAREIAVIFGVSTRAVERMLARAITTLRQAVTG